MFFTDYVDSFRPQIKMDSDMPDNTSPGGPTTAGA